MDALTSATRTAVSKTPAKTDNFRFANTDSCTFAFFVYKTGVFVRYSNHASRPLRTCLDQRQAPGHREPAGPTAGFARAQNWTIVHEYIDRVTGKHSDREQFQKLFADASQRKFDLVLFWSLDRFSREGVLETLNHLQRLQSYGVGYKSLSEQYWILAACSRTPC